MSSQWLLPHSARDAGRYGLTILTVPAMCCVVVGIAQAIHSGELSWWAPGSPTYNNALVMVVVPTGLLTIVYLVKRYSAFHKPAIVLIVHMGFMLATTAGALSVGELNAQLLAYYLVPTLSVGYLWQPKIAYFLTSLTSATVLMVSLATLPPVTAGSVWACVSIVMYGTTLLLVRARIQELAALDSLADIVATDQLTSLGSRAHFDHRLTELATVASGTSVLALIDIDRFKEINDEYGHLIGDEALQELAEHLRAGADLGGEFYRLGGDEFGAVFPDTTLAAALTWATALHERLAATPLAAISDAVVNLETSIGLCALVPGKTTGRIAYSLADGAMYEAKQVHQPAIRQAGSPRDTIPASSEVGC